MKSVFFIITGQVVIPVYSSDDSKHLGKPISLKEASDLLETSINDISQTNLSFASASNLSPLVQSTRARVNHRGLSGSPSASASRSHSCKEGSSEILGGLSRVYIRPNVVDD